MVATSAFGYGIATIAKNGDVLDTWYHTLGLGDPSTPPDLAEFEGADDIRQVSKKSVKVTIKDRKSTRLNSSHVSESRMPSSA